MEFLGRLAILVPPPYFPLVRYHGVFAARSSWRARVTPKPPCGVARPNKPKPCAGEPPAPLRLPSIPSVVPTPTAPQANDRASLSPKPPPSTHAPAAKPVSPVTASSPITASKGARPVPIANEDPTTITVKHWSRLLFGELLATSSRVEWAVLLKRTFGFDANRCPKCDAKMRVLATITDPAVAKKILAHLGMRTEPLARGRARDPTGQMEFGYDAA